MGNWKLEAGGRKIDSNLFPSLLLNPEYVFFFRRIYQGTFRQTCTAWVSL